MRMLRDAPDGTALHHWETDGQRREYSNIVAWVDPDEQYLLEATLDDPVEDFLVRLFEIQTAITRL